MSYRIDPKLQCIVPGCQRPKRAGEEKCTDCWRLARAFGRRDFDFDFDDYEVAEVEAVQAIARAPRCVVYLSQSCDVITLELTGEPKFTDADVERIAATMKKRRRAA